jgi:hypothetical protein
MYGRNCCGKSITNDSQLSYVMHYFSRGVLLAFHARLAATPGQRNCLLFGLFRIKPPTQGF